MASLTVENYLKATLQIAMKAGDDWVSTGALADALDLSPGTVTSMLKTLADSSLAEYRPYSGVRLTDAGRKLAMRVVRRHRLIELFLVQTLDLTWDQVHDEAEHMEHAMSDLLINRIDAFLEHPEVDPHGSPIPTSEGRLRRSVSAAVPLSSCKVGTSARFVRVVNQAPEFLRYLSDSGFELGTVGVVTANSVEGGIVTVRVKDRDVSMGQSAAGTIQVEQSLANG